MYMGGTAMDAPSLHLCVDGRYAIDHYPGIGRVTSMLCHAWAHHPQVRRLDIISNPRSTRSLFELPDTPPHVHIHQLDASPFGISEWWQIYKLMRNLMPDWIYAPYFVMPPRHRPTKRMVTVHDAIPLERNSMPLMRRTIFTQLVRFSMSRADSVTTVSAHAAQQIRQHYKYRDSIEVIPNGVADVFFDTPPHTHLADYGITQPFGLCVSSNQPHKNLDGLLQAWALAYRAGQIPSHSQLVLAGHVDSHREMPWRNPGYADIPIIHLADPDDVLLNQLYHAAHLFVLPSLAEGFGLPILEALAAGCVVLCHDYPTLRQLHGAIVAYTDMQQPHLVAHTIAQLWHDYTIREAFIRHARAHAQAFRWTAIADHYVRSMQTR